MTDRAWRDTWRDVRWGVLKGLMYAGAVIAVGAAYEIFGPTDSLYPEVPFALVAGLIASPAIIAGAVVGAFRSKAAGSYRGAALVGALAGGVVAAVLLAIVAIFGIGLLPLNETLLVLAIGSGGGALAGLVLYSAVSVQQSKDS